MSDQFFVGLDLTALEDNKPMRPVSRVTLLLDDDNAITSGDDTGIEITADCPHATQEMADAILSKLKGYQYHAFTASDTNIDPSAELGDGVTVGGIYGVIAKIDDDGSGYPSIEAPGEAELEEEYPSAGPMTQAFNRKIADTRSSITKTAEQIRLEVQKEVEGLSSSFTVELGDIKAELQDSINGLSASVDLRFEGIEATFSDEIEGLSAEFSAGLSGLSSRVEQVATDASRELADYADVVTRSLGDLQNQIDGQIMTWFYSYEPTTENEPASLWETDDEKIKHLGDVFYIVDDPEKGGQAYRWEYVDGVYRWSLIEDMELAKALADAAKAQDTADNKRRVFVEQPKPPYDVGDLWSQGPNGELMRCNVKRESGSFIEGDWGRASKYTDDSALTTFINGDFKKTISDLEQQADKKAETWYQSADPSDDWEDETTQSEHTGDMWYNTGDKNYYRWNGSGWEQMPINPPQEIFDSIDGKAQVFISTPNPPYHKGDLWFNNESADILTCVNDKLTGLYLYTDWQKRNKYTDDSYARTKYTELKQTIDGITLTAANGDQSSTLTLTSGSTVLTSADITFNGLTKFVSKDSLSSGETEINGACIKTGKVAAEYLELTGAISFSDLNAETQNTINGSKTRTFNTQPTGPYYVGDLWYTEDGDVYRCKIDEPREGLFYKTDWEEVSDAGTLSSIAQDAAREANNTVKSWTYRDSTYIDGAKIMTGTVMASNLLGGSVGLLGEDDYGDPIQVGGIDITLTNNDEDYGLEFWTDRNMGGIRMMSAGTIYLASWVDKSSRYTKPLVQIGEDNVYIGGGANLVPQEDEALDLGEPYFRWYDVYTVNSVTTISDRNLKTNISYDLSAYDALFDLLKPVSFQYAGKYSQSGRTHLGLISQDVETAIADAGLSSMDFAGFVKSPVSGENSVYSLREEEFLPMCIRRVQQLTKRVAELEKRMGAVM